MRTMLLSFKADIYNKVLSGEKIYEHRKVFPNELIKAYLYVSSPVKSIVVIMHLDHRIEIQTWKKQYSYDKSTLLRIDEYMKHHKYAMEIIDFQDTNKIPLKQLRSDLCNFVVPQMYYYIDGLPLLDYLEANLFPCGNKIVHDFSCVSSEQICIK